MWLSHIWLGPSIVQTSRRSQDPTIHTLDTMMADSGILFRVSQSLSVLSTTQTARHFPSVSSVSRKAPPHSTQIRACLMQTNRFKNLLLRSGKDSGTIWTSKTGGRLRARHIRTIRRTSLMCHISALSGLEPPRNN